MQTHKQTDSVDLSTLLRSFASEQSKYRAMFPSISKQYATHSRVTFAL